MLQIWKISVKLKIYTVNVTLLDSRVENPILEVPKSKFSNSLIFATDCRVMFLDTPPARNGACRPFAAISAAPTTTMSWLPATFSRRVRMGVHWRRLGRHQGATGGKPDSETPEIEIFKLAHICTGLPCDVPGHSPGPKWRLPIPAAATRPSTHQARK